MSSLSNNNLQLAPGDTFEEAFSKIEKALIDDELVFSSALNDLNTKINNIPTQVQANWNETSTSSPAYIQNKPTNVSSFTNDSGYYKDVEYDGTNLNINFKDGQTVLDSLNVTQMLLQHGVEYIESTQSASTASWTGVTKSTSLNAGKTIVYRLLKAGTSSNATLNLTFPDGTTSGAKPVYYTADTRATTHYGANSIILLTYDGAGWRRADYNSNTTYSAMTDAQLKDGTVTTAYRISPKILGDNMYINGNTIGIRGETITIKEHELSSEYEPSSLTNEDLFLASGDTYDEAFGKLEKIINDNEIISSAGLVDLDDRVTLVENSKWSKSELGIMTTTEIQSIWDQVFNDE